MGNPGEGQSRGSNPIIQIRPWGLAEIAEPALGWETGSWAACGFLSPTSSPLCPGFLVGSFHLEGGERACALRPWWVGRASEPPGILLPVLGSIHGGKDAPLLAVARSTHPRAPDSGDRASRGRINRS